MAYGVTATTILLSYGTAPAVASASVHAAEVFTTAASGAAHWRLGNVDRTLLWRLALPGMVGGALGAYTLTSFSGDQLRPWIAAYLMVAGGIVLFRGLRPHRRDHALAPGLVVLCGFTAGLLDAMGGGGWGLLVTTSLIWGGTAPRTAIGTASLAEFFVTSVVSVTFIATIGLELWPVILGLIAGGVIAAPIAALVARHVPARPLMVLVGLLVMALSVRQILKAIA